MVRAVKTNPEALSDKIELPGRPIDLVYLARQTLGDPGLEAEILTLFSEMAAVYFDRATHSDDSAEVAMGLHALKGAAAGVGAVAIANEAAAAEAELRDAGAVSAERLSDLGMAVEETRVFIGGLLSK